MEHQDSRKQIGDYIRKRIDQTNERYPEGDSISQKAKAYGHRKPYSGTQYWEQVERDRQSHDAAEADNGDSERDSDGV